MATLGTVGRVWPAAARKADLARIGRYSEQARPSHGRQTLAEHYAALLRGERSAQLGNHAVF